MFVLPNVIHLHLNRQALVQAQLEVVKLLVIQQAMVFMVISKQALVLYQDHAQ
jgi:hypothetical protein